MSRKVSVIVPVYNIKDYLKKCVNSILKQTYKNLEIILLDDGANDGSGELCDGLSQKDSRIVVIHKKNGGVSEARNFGLDKATGDYISFVDGDDYVDFDFIELLVDNLEKHQADVSCCRYTKVWDDGKSEAVGQDHKVEVYENTDALKEYLLAKTMDPFVWNKLYTKDIIGDLRFQIGKPIGEENPFFYQLFSKKVKVVSTGECKYNYLQLRKDSATGSTFSQKHIDSIYWWDGCRKLCEKEHPELVKYALRRQILFYVGLYNSTYNDPDFKPESVKVRRFIKEHLKEITSSDVCEKTVKYSCTLLARTPHIYRIVMRMYKRTVGEARL